MFGSLIPGLQKSPSLSLFLTAETIILLIPVVFSFNGHLITLSSVPSVCDAMCVCTGVRVVYLFFFLNAGVMIFFCAQKVQSHLFIFCLC